MLAAAPWLPNSPWAAQTDRSAPLGGAQSSVSAAAFPRLKKGFAQRIFSRRIWTIWALLGPNGRNSSLPPLGPVTRFGRSKRTKSRPLGKRRGVRTFRRKPKRQGRPEASRKTKGGAPRSSWHGARPSAKNGWRGAREAGDGRGEGIRPAKSTNLGAFGQFRLQRAQKRCRPPAF